MNKIKTDNMLDVFNVVQNSVIQNNNSFELMKKILEIIDITKLKFNWTEYLYTFFRNQLVFNDQTIKEIKKRILSLLYNKQISDEDLDVVVIKQTDKINNVNRFLHLNNLFEKLNELNISHDQSHNLNNYTLLRCQDIYLSCITNPIYNDLINHWFNGIFHNIATDDNGVFFESRYKKGINTLEKYLTRKTSSYDNYEVRNNLVDMFIQNYSLWSAKYLTDKYMSKNIQLTDVFTKLDKVNKINELLIDMPDRCSYLNKTIINLIPCLETYLNEILDKNQQIDSKIINAYNNVNLSNTDYNKIVFDFCNKWKNKIKERITLSNFNNSKLLSDLIKICPLIDSSRKGVNVQNEITKCISDIFNADLNLLGYLLTGLNGYIKKSQDHKMTQEITNILTLISLFENKELLWTKYLNNSSYRIFNISKKNHINQQIINFELEIHNYLVNNDCLSFSDKTKIFLADIKNSVDHLNVINKCKLNFVDDNGMPKIPDDNWYNPDINKTEYVIIDKQVYEMIKTESIKYNLIDYDKYPVDIKTYLNIGKTYYDKAFEIKKIEWDVENSIINYNISNHNIISNITQYIILWHINNNKYNCNSLISHLVNNNLDDKTKIDAKKYLESYIDDLIIKHIVNIQSNDLTINIALDNNYIDISSFVPALISKSTIDNTKNVKQDMINIDITRPIPINEIAMTNECLSYLRTLMMVKMFKTHSKKIYPLKDIISSLDKHINKHLQTVKLNKKLEDIIRSLTNIDEIQLVKELTNLEKKDIIEKTSKDSIEGYIYVVG